MEFESDIFEFLKFQKCDIFQLKMANLELNHSEKIWTTAGVSFIVGTDGYLKRFSSALNKLQWGPKYINQQFERKNKMNRI